jgi:hypothetical protein
MISEKGSQLGAHLLILGEALQKLEEDYFQFTSLLQSLKESFLRTKK